MSSRGSVVKNGHVGTYQYNTVEVLPSGAKVLEGNKGFHTLPDYSHSPNAVYVKFNASKNFVTLRFYGTDHRMYLEIAYHPEPNLGKPGVPCWHYHVYGPDLKHDNVYLVTNEIIQKYGKYLEDVGYGTKFA